MSCHITSIFFIVPSKEMCLAAASKNKRDSASPKYTKYVQMNIKDSEQKQK